MTAPFQPKGDRPQWQMVLDVLMPLDVGDVLTYEQLDEIVPGFKTNRTPLYKAAVVWGQERKRALAPVNNVGYRVVDAPEHELIARGHHKRSKRALRRGRAVIENADRSRLSEADRVRFDAMELNLSRQADLIRRLDSRVAKVERVLAESRKVVASAPETQARLARLEEALKRHGIEVPAEAAFVTPALEAT